MECSERSAPRIGIIGLGNVLMRDDGFGPYVIESLVAGYSFPVGVLLMDLGTPSLDLVAHIEGLDALVLVDTVHSAGRAGELRRYRLSEILEHPIQPRISPHEPGLKEALLIAQFDGRAPRETLLIGVIPQSTATGTGLSDAVRSAVPRAIDAVINELRRLGVIAFQLTPARPPRIWWEQWQ